MKVKEIKSNIQKDMEICRMPLKPCRESLKDGNKYCAIPEHRPPTCFGCEQIHSLSKLRL
jgi:hypothetical protein